MRSASSKRNLWIEAGIAVLFIVLAAAAFYRSETRPLGVDDVKISTSDLRALAASGQQLCEQYVRDVQTETFFDTQSSLLRDKVKSLRSSLESAAAEPDVQGDLDRARSLATELESAFARLDAQPRDVPAVQNALTAMVPQLKQLEEKLKKESQTKK